MDTYGEPLFDWRPVLFFGWMAFVIVGAWITASIKARSDEHRHGFVNWLIWFGGLIATGVVVSLLYVAAVTVNRWADTHVWGVLGLAG